MKRSKFFVLVSLCSVFALMPAKACEMRDSVLVDKSDFKELVEDFRQCAISCTFNSNDIIEELKKVFNERDVIGLREISHVNKKQKFGYGEYEQNYHWLRSYHLKRIPENVLKSVLEKLDCRYGISSYKDKLEFFVAKGTASDKPDFYLFCCPKSDQELCKKLENKFFQQKKMQPEKPLDAGDPKLKEWYERVYKDDLDAYQEQNRVLQKRGDIGLFDKNFIEELLERNENLNIVGEFGYWFMGYQPSDVRYHIVKFDAN